MIKKLKIRSKVPIMGHREAHNADVNETKRPRATNGGKIMGLYIDIIGLENEDSATTFRLLVSEDMLSSIETYEDTEEDAEI